MSAEKLEKGHRLHGRWILAPVSDITTPKGGRRCYGPSWWIVTDADEVLFFERYTSPQCNSNEAVMRKYRGSFGAPAGTPKFIEMAYLPHRCRDYC